MGGGDTTCTRKLSPATKLVRRTCCAYHFRISFPARGSAGSGFFEKIRRAASNPALAGGPASVGVGEAVLLNGAGGGHKKAASVPGSPKPRPIAGKGKKAD